MSIIHYSQCAFMVLETDLPEGQDYTFFYHQTENSPSAYANLKGPIFAATGIVNNIFGEDLKYLSFFDQKTKHYYKAASSSFTKNKVAAVVCDSNYPDNVASFLLLEFISFIDFFFENIDEAASNKQIIAKYCDNLVYHTRQFVSPTVEIMDSTITNVPLSAMLYSFNEKETCFLIKPPISTNIKAEVIEIVNNLNSDRSLLHESLTLADIPAFPRGCCLLFRGFTIFNSLSNFEMNNLAKIASLNGMFERQNSSEEVIICEEMHIDEKRENPLYYVGIKEKKPVMATIVSIREFTLMLYLDVLGKENSHYDPYYTKRAEDLMLNILNKNFNFLLNSDIYLNAVKPEEEGGNVERLVKEISQEKEILSTTEIRTREQSKTKSSSGLSGVMPKIKGSLIVLHYAVYDNKENSLCAHDLCLPEEKYEIYREINRNYATFQGNINKLIRRRKQLNNRTIFSYDDIFMSRGEKLRRPVSVKTKEAKEKYIQALQPVKIEEFGVKSKIEGVNLWSCCKIYEVSGLNENELEDFRNFKIVFLSYESRVPKQIDDYCEELLLSDLFI